MVGAAAAHSDDPERDAVAGGARKRGSSRGAHEGAAGKIRLAHQIDCTTKELVIPSRDRKGADTAPRGRGSSWRAYPWPMRISQPIPNRASRKQPNT